jgi:hypothetical protein
MPLFKRESKIRIVNPEKQQTNEQAQSPMPMPLSSSEPKPKGEEQTEIPAELQPLAQRWRENLRLMAQARFTPAIMLEDKAFYVLQNLPPNFDSKTGITTVTVRAIGEDMRIYEATQKIQIDKYGRVLRLGNEVKPIDKPADFGVSADVAIQIVKAVAEGSNPIPIEYGLR